MNAENDQASRRRVSRRHTQLLAALLGFHLAAPAVQMLAPKLTLILLLPLYVIVLAAATMVMSSSRSRSIIATLAAPMIAAAIASAAAVERAPLIISASTLPFLAYAAAVVLWSVLKPGVIDQTRVLGSASVFILAAQAWASAYAGLELLTPGTFALPADRPVAPGDLTYFSFTTQTTLGYGDVTPQSPIARAAATLQATAGLFYMGVIVARFAGRLRIAGNTHNQATSPNRDSN